MFSNYPLYRHAQGVRLELINLRKISQKTPNFEKIRIYGRGKEHTIFAEGKDI
jgi:hypothetical protein